MFVTVMNFFSCSLYLFILFYFFYFFSFRWLRCHCHSSKCNIFFSISKAVHSYKNFSEHRRYSYHPRGLPDHGDPHQFNQHWHMASSFFWAGDGATVWSLCGQGPSLGEWFGRVPGTCGGLLEWCFRVYLWHVKLDSCGLLHCLQTTWIFRTR